MAYVPPYSGMCIRIFLITDVHLFSLFSVAPVSGSLKSLEAMEGQIKTWSLK